MTAAARGRPGPHLLANKGAQWDVLQGPHAPAHVLRPIELQPRPGKQDQPLTATFHHTHVTTRVTGVNNTENTIFMSGDALELRMQCSSDS